MSDIKPSDSRRTEFCEAGRPVPHENSLQHLKTPKTGRIFNTMNIERIIEFGRELNEMVEHGQTFEMPDAGGRMSQVSLQDVRQRFYAFLNRQTDSFKLWRLNGVTTELQKTEFTRVS